MLYEITHLKAPWPAEAKVGDVVEFDGAVPPWAVGKVKPSDARSATVELPVFVANIVPESGQSDLVAELRGRVADLEAQLAAVNEVKGDTDEAKAAAARAEADEQARAERAALERKGKKA